MEIKLNEATELRPDGDRIMDAPLVVMDLNESIKIIKSEVAWKEKDRNAITVYKTNGLRMVLIALHKGAELARHKAGGIISVQVMEGEINFTTDQKSANLKTGQAIALHEGLYHSVNAIKESVFFLTLTTSLEK